MQSAEEEGGHQRVSNLFFSDWKTLFSVIFHTSISVSHFNFSSLFPLLLCFQLLSQNTHTTSAIKRNRALHIAPLFSKYSYTFPFIPGCAQLKCNPPSPTPSPLLLSPICCWVPELLRKRSVNLLSKTAGRRAAFLPEYSTCCLSASMHSVTMETPTKYTGLFNSV